MKKLIGCLALLLATAAQASPDVVVQGVQMPAWLQRGVLMQPLAVGTELQRGDQLVTGNHARVLLQGADGSAIKLGENAVLRFDELAQRREQRSLFSAVLNVAKGAFRFTTSSLDKFKPRDVKVKVAGATVGIRGTDLWGKDGADAQGMAMGVVCLIEGKVSVTGADNIPFVMDEPLDFYKMPKGAMPMRGKVDPEQLNKWAQETEINQPAAKLGGHWKVRLLTADSEAEALTAYDTWRTAGYNVRIQPHPQTEGWAYQLLLGGLATRAEAAGLATQLTGQMGADKPSVVR